MNNMPEWPIIRPLLRLLNSSKFWALLFPALLSLGLDVSAQIQALIIFLAGAIYAVTTAWEDSAASPHLYAAAAAMSKDAAEK